jgi:small subunit ribosomal protein S10
MVPKLRIILKSYEKNILDSSCETLMQSVRENDEVSLIGPVRLPTRRRIYCVLRSPHVNKDSREHFEIRTHKRLIDIYKPSLQTFKALSELEFEAGIDIEIKTKKI